MQYMSHSNPSRPSRDPHYLGFFLPRNILKGVAKNAVHEVLDFLKKRLG